MYKDRTVYAKKLKDKRKETAARLRKEGYYDEWYRNNRYKTAKSLAKRKDKEFNLSESQYLDLIKMPCYYCDNFLKETDKFKGIGLDRLDSSKGYIEDNVVSCCGLCNSIKNNKLTVEETIAAVHAIIAIRLKQNHVF